jgi:BlaI family penicillinase repressor
MEIKLSDAEFIIMEILWREGEIRASKVADIARKETGWEKNTTYTLINRVINKGAVKRSNPNFLCSTTLKRSEISSTESKNFLEKMYGGSLKLFVQAFLDEQKISDEELNELKKLINNHQ